MTPQPKSDRPKDENEDEDEQCQCPHCNAKTDPTKWVFDEINQHDEEIFAAPCCNMRIPAPQLSFKPGVKQ